MTILAEIDWMADKRLSIAGKLLLFNPYPIFRELHGLIDAELVVNFRFVAKDNAENRGVVIGPGVVLISVRIRPDKDWNERVPLSKAPVDWVRIRIEEVIRDRYEDFDAEQLAIVQEVFVVVARFPVVEPDQIRAH